MPQRQGIPSSLYLPPKRPKPSLKDKLYRSFRWLQKLFPFKMLASILGVGRIQALPEVWSGAFLSLPIAIIAISLTTGFGVIIAQLAFPLLLTTIILFIIGWISTAVIFHLYPEEENVILIDQAVGLLFVFALSAPALVALKLFITNIVIFLCGGFLVCSALFIVTSSWVLTITSIYVTYCYIVQVMPPPIPFINQYCRGSFAIMMDDIIAALYTLIILYFLGFFFLGMDLYLAGRFFNYLFNSLVYSLHYLF